MSISIDDICGAILAGGRGERMGGQDKGLVNYQGRPLIEHVLARLQPQLPRLIININRNQHRYNKYNLPLCSDRIADYQGPLAGIASGFDCSDSPYLLFCPCDTPSLPNDLVVRLIETLSQQQASLAVVKSPRGMQPLFCLIHRSLNPSLRQYLASGERRVQEWVLQQGPAICHYASDEPFSNINTLAQTQDEQLQI